MSHRETPGPADFYRACRGGIGRARLVAMGLCFDRGVWAAAGPGHWQTVGQDRTVPATLPGAGPGEPLSPQFFDSRAPAVQWARDHIVPAEGAAAVVDLRGEHPVERARYLRAVTDADLDPVSRQLGAPAPAGWRSYVLQPSWLTQGWMAVSGSFVMVYTPDMAADITEEWTYDWPAVPGVTGAARERPDQLLLIGSDGGPTHLAVDAAVADSPVYAVPNVCDSWDEQAIVRATGMADFGAQVDAGTFSFH